jgi:hypothetical protein
LRHERSSGEIGDHPDVVPLAQHTYETLMDIVANGESKELLDRLDLLRMKFNEACRTFEPAVADMEAARYKLVTERDELVAARDKQDSLTAARGSLLAATNGLTREHDELKAERDALRDDNKRLLSERHAVLASTSWRVTAPLRSFKRLLSQSSRLFDRARRASGR